MALIDQDIGTVIEFTFAYFVNTNEFRHKVRDDLWIHIDPDRPVLDEEGNDKRSFEQQKDALMGDFLSLLPEKSD